VKPLLCLRHEEPDHLGTAAQVFAASGIEVSYMDLWSGARLPDPREVAGVVVLGGVMNVDEVDAHPFLLPERDFLHTAVAADVPLLGICLGGQLLARSLGARVLRSRASEAGFFPLHPTDEAAGDPLFSCFRDGDRMFQWHEDTFELPAGASLLLAGNGVTNQAFRAGERAWGVQFHPEVTPQLLEAWLDATREDELMERWSRTRTELRAQAERYLPSQRRRARQLFGRFASIVAERVKPRSEESGPSLELRDVRGAR
jgi:GMP synthase-like glutamine amidotransferase